MREASLLLCRTGKRTKVSMTVNDLNVGALAELGRTWESDLPAVTEPPGELTYMVMSFWLLLSRYKSSATSTAHAADMLLPVMAKVMHALKYDLLFCGFEPCT